MECVLIYSGYCNKIVNNKNLFLSSVDCESKIKVLADSATGEGPFLGSQMATSSCPYMVEEVNELPWASFIRAPFSKRIHFLMPPLEGLRFQNINFGEP